MKTFTFAAVLSSLMAMAFAQGQKPQGLGLYCLELADGNYNYPSDCTKFITCSNGFAYEMDCGPCDLSNGVDRCPDGKLHYSKATGKCEWATLANCTGGTSTDSTVSPPPPVQGSTPTDAPGDNIHTTLPSSGEDCDPNSCKHIGDCINFQICNKETKKWQLHTCADNLFWNQDVNKKETNGLGGSCDFWDNLSQETQDRYNDTRTCFPDCYYKKIDVCSENYIFHPAHTELRNVINLTCPRGLIYNPELEVCDLMKNVRGCERSIFSTTAPVS